MMRRRMVALLAMGTASCSLLTSLDYLETHAADASTPPSDGAPSPGENDGPSAPDPLACPSATCDVIASDITITAMSGSTDLHGVTYADGERDALMYVQCNPRCDLPVQIMTGEHDVRTFAYDDGLLFWTAGSNLRSATFYGLDAGAPQTLAATDHPTALVMTYPYFVLADANGLRRGYYSQQNPSFTDYTKPVSTVVETTQQLLFIAEGAVQRCYPDQGAGNCKQLGTVAGTQGATHVAYAAGFSVVIFIFASGGIITALPRDGGGSVLFNADVSPDAGGSRIVAESTEPIVALDARGDDIWFTTTTGELRRRSKISEDVVTVARGLGAHTLLAVGDGQAFVADLDARRLVRVVR